MEAAIRLSVHVSESAAVCTFNVHTYVLSTIHLYSYCTSLVASETRAPARGDQGAATPRAAAPGPAGAARPSVLRLLLRKSGEIHLFFTSHLTSPRCGP
jgi:hypothetical protein